MLHRLACLALALIAAGCVSVNSYVLADAFTPRSDANACFRKCQQVGNSFRGRCLDLCPGTRRVKGKDCADIVVSERDACYQTRDPSLTPIVVLLGVVLLGVLTFGVLALHHGALAH